MVKILKIDKYISKVKTIINVAYMMEEITNMLNMLYLDNWAGCQKI